MSAVASIDISFNLFSLSFLGIKVVGGISNAPGEPGFGIFIKKVLHGGRASEDGKIIFNCYVDRSE